MSVEIREEPMTQLVEHATISIAFRVDRVLEVTLVDGGLGGILLSERPVAATYVKDYDADSGEGPTRWLKRWDVTNWGLLSAHADDVRIGGAVLAWNTPGVNMLEGRSDLAALWDLRIAPEQRRTGVGRKLFAGAEKWAASRGCRQLKIETQNINVAACRFYAERGCVLGAVDRFAYPDLPQETRLLWYKDLQGNNATMSHVSGTPAPA